MGPEEKIAGILGGMGPEATTDLMQRIIRLTPALDDIDHIRCIVDNNPKVPSRIKAIIEGTGEDPGPVMADMGRRLAAFGADFLAIACNTAHFYHGAVQAAVDIPVLHMVELVTRHIWDTYHQTDTVGILASPAVAITGLYEKAFEPFGLRALWPEPEYQDLLLDVIKTVKKGNTGPDVRQNYKKVAQTLAAQGASVAVVACTELSALGERLSIDTVDAAEVLAAEIVRFAKNR
ncbi:MAG: aspartate racemase RacD [Desulfobacterales bacterium]|nr:MAG: aspartate racemase RacD [Desulfobacterales bacterium]